MTSTQTASSSRRLAGTARHQPMALMGGIEAAAEQADAHAGAGRRQLGDAGDVQGWRRVRAGSGRCRGPGI